MILDAHMGPEASMLNKYIHYTHTYIFAVDLQVSGKLGAVLSTLRSRTCYSNARWQQWLQATGYILSDAQVGDVAWMYSCPTTRIELCFAQTSKLPITADVVQIGHTLVDCLIATTGHTQLTLHPTLPNDAQLFLQTCVTPSRRFQMPTC